VVFKEKQFTYVFLVAHFTSLLQRNKSDD